jgi:hypothetical protein
MKKLSFSPLMAQANDRGLKTLTRRLISADSVEESQHEITFWYDRGYSISLQKNAFKANGKLVPVGDDSFKKLGKLFKFLKPSELVYEARQFTSQKTGKNTAGMYMSEVQATRCLQVQHLWLERLGTDPEDSYADEGIAVLPYYREMKEAGATGQQIYARLWNSLNTDPALRFENQPWALCIEYAVYATKEAGSKVWQRVNGGVCFPVTSCVAEG